MKTRILDSERDRVLRALDPALTYDPVDRDRQTELFATVLASNTGIETTSDPTLRRRRHGRRLALAGVVVGAVAAGALVLPGLSNGYAYASWTPDPEPVSAPDLALVHTACLDDFGSGPPENQGADRVVAKDLTVRLAERRGSWVGVLLTGNQSSTTWEVSCLAELPVGTTDVKHISVAASGGGGFAAPGPTSWSPAGSPSSASTTACSAAADANRHQSPPARSDPTSPRSPSPPATPPRKPP